MLSSQLSFNFNTRQWLDRANHRDSVIVAIILSDSFVIVTVRDCHLIVCTTAIIGRLNSDDE